VKLSGTYTLPVPPDRAYTLLQDPLVLAKSLPGCERLDLIGENEYAMKMKMILASISGQFEGKVRIADANPPASFRMIVDGSGKIGFMKGEGVINLTPADIGTAVHYEGDVQVGGLIANVGQRLIETTSKLILKRFFRSLANGAVQPGGTGASACQGE
jgi:carbon monoxide dehydrogenase subunit G